MGDSGNTIAVRRSKITAFIPHALAIVVVVIIVDVLLAFQAQVHKPTNAIAARVAADVASIRAAVLEHPGSVEGSIASEAHTLSRLTGSIPVSAMLVLPPGLSRTTSHSGESLVVVCTAAYADSPRRAFWNLWLARPKHTIGFADGSTALLSEEQFAELDLSGFVPLREWLSGL